MNISIETRRWERVFSHSLILPFARAKLPMTLSFFWETENWLEIVNYFRHQLRERLSVSLIFCVVHSWSLINENDIKSSIYVWLLKWTLNTLLHSLDALSGRSFLSYLAERRLFRLINFWVFPHNTRNFLGNRKQVFDSSICCSFPTAFYAQGLFVVFHALCAYTSNVGDSEPTAKLIWVFAYLAFTPKRKNT